MSCGYDNNCYLIINNETKIFLASETGTQETSCYQYSNIHHKYIIENTNECIDPPLFGYYISNPETGILSQCHPNCLTCRGGKEISDGKLINMKCKAWEILVTDQFI